MSTISGFAPIAHQSSRVLVLGSMPGRDSLAARQYYAHPRNAFWKIMAAILGFSAQARYEERIKALGDADIALWNVLHSCIRQGSLDADIEVGSIMVNDFQTFFERHPCIKLVCFNGKTAEQHYRRQVLPVLSSCQLTYSGLPSTSPAHASLTLADKITSWRAALSSQL